MLDIRQIQTTPPLWLATPARVQHSPNWYHLVEPKRLQDRNIYNYNELQYNTTHIQHVLLFKKFHNKFSCTLLYTKRRFMDLHCLPA